MKHVPSSGLRAVLATVSAAALTLLALAGQARAQEECLDEVEPQLLNTSALPDGPLVLRSIGVDLFRWGGHRYLAQNTGNNLRLQGLDDPLDPGPSAASSFGVPPFGDRDYNLFNFAVCDECRYGIAGFQSAGTVLFDLGQLGQPYFATSHYYPDARNVGGFTFMHGSPPQQYLIASGLLEVCGGGAALMAFGGVLPGHLTLLQCANDAAGNPLTVDGGYYVPDSPNAYVYLVGGSKVHTLMVTEGDSGLGLEYRGQFMRASWSRIRGLDVDLDAGPYGRLAAVANPLHVEIWGLGDGTPGVSPDNPLLVAQWDPTPPMVIAPNSVAIEYPYLWVGASGGQGTGWTYTYDITDPSSPQPLDVGFWDTGYTWNSYAYGSNIAAEFTDDANYLLLSRWSVLLRISFEVCSTLFADDFESGDTSAWAEVSLPPRSP